MRYVTFALKGVKNQPIPTIVGLKEHVLTAEDLQ